MKDHKTYADKGVQTGSRIDKYSPAFSHPDAQCIYKALDDSQSSGLRSPSHFLDHSSAYIDPDVSLPDHLRYISERPALDNQRALKYGHLGYGKPSHLASASDRIVSLPETSPPYRITQSPGRLVSMPENLKMLRYSYDHSQSHPGHSECFNVSLTSDGTAQTKSFEGEHALLCEIPQTPSPPSSPESVMIIGNDDRVQQAFLRPKSAVDDTGHEGWTPWKGSPPKPIPALHGPLSLPYARCPSGAEGTVIEGDDLTHMIWGLDSNGLQLAQSKHQTNGQFCKPLLKHMPSSRSSEETPLALHRNHTLQNICDQDVIDLSRPEFQATPSHVSDVQLGRPLRTYLSPVEDSHLSRRDIQSKKVNIYEFVRRDSPIQLYPTSLGLLPEAKPCNAGLGIDLWRGNFESRTFDATLVSRDTRDSPLVLNQPLESMYPTSIYHTPRNLPVCDIRAVEHIGSRPGIPTPPNTSSPRWSPRFHHSHIASMSPELHSQIPSNHPVNFSQHLVPRSTRDTLVWPQQVQSQALFEKPERHSAAPGLLEVVVDAHRLPPLHFSPDSLGANCSGTDSHEISPQHRFSQDKPNITPLSPASPELRRGLAQHQPRSIPLARLIQRRLSSVVEEEVESGPCDVHKPPALIPPNANQGSGCPKPDVSNTPQEDQKRAQIPGREAAITINSAAGPSNDHAKRAYKPPGHPSRHTTVGIRSASTQVQRSPKADQPTTSANRSGGNKENTTATQRTSSKSKKMARKKKHFKKHDFSPAADN